MRAAVVRSFDQPLSIEEVPTPVPGLVRCWCGSRPRACATPTSTPLAASGPSSRRRRSSPVMRAWAASSSSVTARCTSSRWGRGSRCRGSATPVAAAAGCNSGWETLCPDQLNTGYSINGRLRRRTRSATRATSSTRARCDRPARRRAADVRGRHDLQGGQGLRARSVGPRRGLRRRWPRATSAIQYARDRSAPRWSPSTSTTHRLAGAREVGAAHLVNAAEQDPIAAIQRLGGADVAIATAVDRRRLRAGALARSRAAARSSLVGLPRRQRDGAADLRDRARRHHAQGLDRRHPPRPRRGLRAPRPRPHPRRALPSASWRTSTR